MIATAILVAQALPVPTLTIEPSWPESYNCRIVTSATDTVEFGLKVKDSNLVIDRSFLQISAGKAIPVKKSGPGIKSGNGYARHLIAETGPGFVTISQAGTVTDLMTSLFISMEDLGHSISEHRTQASGFCVPVSQQNLKVLAQ